MAVTPVGVEGKLNRLFDGSNHDTLQENVKPKNGEYVKLQNDRGELSILREYVKLSTSSARV